MGTSSGPQEQQVREKVQKGWLSRWTRKQWSRHWFVLKNGSITYYRGPAAELCSFLDGVLDLSLIKHIEVPQQVEGARSALHQHANSAPPGAGQNYAFNYQQNLSQYQQQQQQQHQHQQQQQQQQSHQLNSHFDFTLKMWNGECHLLSAASASERQSWLAAIHSCGSFDDSTSDSSASSDSSMSAKSTDIGKSTSAGPARNPSSAATPAGSQAHNSFLNSYQAQQQQQREAELSLEQLALKLKSVVRRSNAPRSTYPEPEGGALERPGEQQKQQQKQQQQQNSSQIREQQHTKPTSQAGSSRPIFCKKAQDEEQDEEQDEDDETSDESENGDEELDQMDDDDDDDDDDRDHEDEADSQSSASEPEPEVMGERAENQTHKRNLNSPKSTSEPKLLKRDGELRQKGVEQPVGAGNEEARMLPAGGNSASSPAAGRPLPQPATSLLKCASAGQPATLQRQKKRVTFDLSNQDPGRYSHIERDLLSSSASGSEESCSSSPSTSSDEAECELEEGRLSGAKGSEPQMGRQSESSNRTSADDKSVTSSSVPSSPEDGQLASCGGEMLHLEQIREIEQRRKLEFKKQLSYSQQRANDEDEDSTCELVRRMIERRKLRLLNMQRQREIDDAPADGRRELDANDAPASHAADHIDQQLDHSSATSSCQMETNEEATEGRVDSSSSSCSSRFSSESKESQESPTSRTTDQLKQLNHIDQLEERLKSAMFNIEHLERRLNDSYLSYNQLELSYNQLQLKLVECQQLHSSSLMQSQTKIDELRRELEASEFKLLEAKEKLLTYEEHLAKWQQQSQSTGDQRNVAREPNSNLGPIQRQTGASRWAHQKTCSWLMKNSSYLTGVNHNLTGSHLITGVHNQHQEQVHQPLLLMHQLKQTLSMNQQQLSLKLLNQSKQIQRKLNELESKVDRIQATDCKHLATRSNNESSLSTAGDTSH